MDKGIEGDFMEPIKELFLKLNLKGDFIDVKMEPIRGCCCYYKADCNCNVDCDCNCDCDCGYDCRPSDCRGACDCVCDQNCDCDCDCDCNCNSDCTDCTTPCIL